MPDVLVRDVSSADLEQIRAAATEQGTSLQRYLRDALHAQARRLRRQKAIIEVSQRLSDSPPVPEGERQAVLDEMAHDAEARATSLAGRIVR